MSKRIPRCWQDGPKVDDLTGSSCLLPADHDGPHSWTPDDKIPARYREHPAARVVIDGAESEDSRPIGVRGGDQSGEKG